MTPKRLKQIRGSMKMTQAQLAAALGVRQETVARWEIGSRRIPEPTARLIAFLGRIAGRIEAGRIENLLLTQLVRRADARVGRGGRSKKRRT